MSKKAPFKAPFKLGAHEGWDLTLNVEGIPVPPGTLYMPFRDPNYDIRICLILPGLPHEEIGCILIYISIRPFMTAENLENMQYYEALSYAWGDTSITEPILLDGQEYQVTTNLKAALRHLRWVSRARPLWIDALCINQKDLEEKAKQVSLMGQIFRHAGAVICWLGKEAENSGYAMYLLDELSELELHEDSPLMENTNAANSLFRRPLMKLLQRSWWSRAWIVQEIVLGKNVLIYCGGRSIPWKNVKSALTYLEVRRISGEEEDLLPEIWSHIWYTVKTKPVWIGKEGHETTCAGRIADILGANRSRGATDARDKSMRS